MQYNGMSRAQRSGVMYDLDLVSAGRVGRVSATFITNLRDNLGEVRQPQSNKSDRNESAVLLIKFDLI